MMTLQEMCDIAVRYDSLMARRFVVACVQRSYRTGEPLDVDPDLLRSVVREACQGHSFVVTEDSPEWRLYVERNSDTRWTHV